MELTILKDWAEHKKGSKIVIEDISVIEAGLKIGLFEEVKPKKAK